MKILIMIPLWKRPEVVRLFVDKLKAVMPEDITLIPFFILSPEDPYYKVHKELISGFIHFEYKNDPLGEKKNAGLISALQIDWDYYMDIGSDNVLTKYIWELYRPLLKANNPYFGIKNIHVLDILQNKARYTEGYHSNNGIATALGVGRCIRRDVVLDCAPLWINKWNCGMDGSSHMKITKKGYECTVIDNKQPTALDVKTSTNITSFNEIEKEGIEYPVKDIYAEFELNQFNIWNSDFTTLVTFEGFREKVLELREVYENQERAFEAVNTTYEIGFGKRKYKNYSVYRTTQTKHFKR